MNLIHPHMIQTLQAENDRLRATLKLHAGDVMSLSNELDEWRSRALAAEEALSAVQTTPTKQD